ncbi:uncharacterized protein LOC129770974 isoform X2 [Toxorhynchites rutilus septentrionalis]|uniref:uncharacterized protein LOC129770974 isoform X2 n=1 Tax=Toxorhynchites rutilus septentrionalis TaxID=329112 RepID=UPI00247A00D2|nr:uncharacterized protein LOC129770974 isoform X2 [Toxorhynchites rutilus septentrionalis]
MQSANESDWEPLLETDTRTTKRVAGGAAPCATNRRETKGIIINQEKCGRIRLGVVVVLVFIFFYLSLSTINMRPLVQQMVVNIPDDDEDLPGPRVPKGFLVFGPGCKMLDLDPLAHDVMRLFHKEQFIPCSPKRPLTSIEQTFDNDSIVLQFHREYVTDHLPHYMKYIECCYHSIERAGVGEKADKNFNLDECKFFSHDIHLPASVTSGVLVRCKGSVSANSKTRKSVYTNVHAFIRTKASVRERLDRFRQQSNLPRPLSVLMVGIDSISRLNLIRAMPHTAQHLYDTGWFELKGYNKIDDNTYPNLMAILTGYNNTLAYDVCNPRKVGQLETCPFLWNNFTQSGYVTAYAEDEASINTFNYHKHGFVQQPTDYYLRPIALAAEKYLTKKTKNSLTFCLGYQNYADLIYQYALDFATFYKDEPSFGLFWTNTFSHNDISDPSSMDLRMKYYIEELDNRGILNTSMVVFFSDHGLRFGAVRSLLTGWLEERLPFIFIWLPEWFKEQHPHIVQALKVNRNRLTNPYDLHVTLKHVLELSGRSVDSPAPLSCPNCQSLFQEMPWNRSCEETSIAPHWCTCSDFEKIDKGSKIVQEAVRFVIDAINADLGENQKNLTKKLCAKMQLKSISLAKMAKYANAEVPHNDYLLIFDGKPGGGKFESTVRHYTERNAFEVTGSISRLNEYASQSECMHVDYLRKYCYCLQRKGR